MPPEPILPVNGPSNPSESHPPYSSEVPEVPYIPGEGEPPVPPIPYKAILPPPMKLLTKPEGLSLPMVQELIETPREGEHYAHLEKSLLFEHICEKKLKPDIQLKKPWKFKWPVPCCPPCWPPSDCCGPKPPGPTEP